MAVGVLLADLLTKYGDEPVRCLRSHLEEMIIIITLQIIHARKVIREWKRLEFSTVTHLSETTDYFLPASGGRPAVVV
ncbi:hypothetical protein J6590_003561 [Homalodisca vitripennis]|nr:hypothetical protein J6590_003561 [Homalodisca vitripennis]